MSIQIFFGRVGDRTPGWFRGKVRVRKKGDRTRTPGDCDDRKEEVFIVLEIVVKLAVVT